MWPRVWLVLLVACKSNPGGVASGSGSAVTPQITASAPAMDAAPIAPTRVAGVGYPEGKAYDITLPPEVRLAGVESDGDELPAYARFEGGGLAFRLRMPEEWGEVGFKLAAEKGIIDRSEKVTFDRADEQADGWTMIYKQGPGNGPDSPYANKYAARVAKIYLRVECGSSEVDTREQAERVVAICQTVRASPEPAGNAAAGSAAAGALALAAGEALHAPKIEAAWRVGGTDLTASVVDATVRGRAITKLVVWGGGKRYDIVKTSSACDADVALRPVSRGRLVFRCARRPRGDEREGQIEEWRIRWSAKKHAPLRNRHWMGFPEDDEPSWAESGKPLSDHPAKSHASSTKCCCESTLDGATTYNWLERAACKPDPDNEESNDCVALAKCQAGAPD